MEFRNKKIFVGVLIILIVVVFAIFYWQNNNKTTPSNKNADIILFYGDGCPHCAVLEEWIANNGIAEKIEFSRLEVYNSKDNQKILIEKATACGLATDSVGVPFLWTGSNCVIGDEPIEQFFQEKINLNKNITTNETNETKQ